MGTRDLRRVLALAFVLATLAVGTASPVAAAGSTGGSAGGNFAKRVDIGGRKIYITCRGRARSDDPTIVLESGYHDSSDVWVHRDVLDLHAPAVGPPVFTALAATHRVCACDRPGTIRYVEGTPLTRRSPPVPQPRTAADIVTELHQTLRAAHVPGPYLLVDHSLGGMMVLLYARTYPAETRGVVFDDAFSPTVPGVFGPLWSAYRDELLNPPPAQMPLPSLRSPESERVDLDVSARQTLEAPALPAIPLAVLTKTESFSGLQDAPGITAAQVDTFYAQAQTYLVQLSPSTPQQFATGSDHYIQFSQPDLVVGATELVLDRIRGHD